MSWRLLARLVFVFAALGSCYDAGFNGTGHTAVIATPIGDTLGWVTRKIHPTSRMHGYRHKILLSDVSTP